MPVTTYVENGCLVGYHPPTGLETRVPLREIFVEAGADLDEAELGALDELAGGETIVGALEAYAPEIGADLEIGASKKKRKAKRKKRRAKIKKGLKKGIKKIAKSKILKGIAKIAAKVVPAPFNAPILAAQGAAKFARALKKKNPKAKKLKAAVQKAAAGKLSSKQLAAQAKKLGVSAKIVTDAAAVKRLAMDAQTNPRAKAALRLAADLTDTNPIKQQLALAAAAQAQAGPNARAFVVQAPGGETFRTLVQSGS